MAQGSKSVAWLNLAFGTLNVVLGALALAAVWAFVSMFSQRTLAPAATLLGLGTGLLARASLPQTRRYGAVLAAVATFAAAYYQQILMAAVRVASTLDLPLLAALRQSGVGLLTLLARLALAGPLLLWILLGAALAVLAAWPFSRRGS
ncbi:hypothetical protein [Metallibacterium sp.]|uniref:hypothetical protein n=1 Tax=Metallibacterium sp. TaxID=2940281 RepID=UPI00260BAE71|nr:hypothetical protein [Metallibacterium sp.]